MSAFPVITYEDGKVFCAATTCLTEVRRQLKLEPSQKFCYIERPAPKSILDAQSNSTTSNLLVKPISLEIKPEQESCDKFAEKLLLSNGNSNGNFFASSTTMATTTSGPLPFVQIEVSPRGFYIPQDEFAFAGLTTSQRVFGCAATSVRLLSRQQYAVLFEQNELITKIKNNNDDPASKIISNNGILPSSSPISATSGASSPTQNSLTYAPLPKFFICAKIENWSGKKALSTRLFSTNNNNNIREHGNNDNEPSSQDDVNFALAVLTEIALLISSRGSNNIIQLKTIYFDPSDKEKRDLYVICEEGPAELTTDIATFSSKILPNMDQLFNNSKQQEFSPLLLLDPKAGSSSKAVNAKILRNATGAGGSSGVAGVASEIYEGDLRTSSTAEAVELCFDATRQILDGIAHLHELGVVHGGVSPRNILASKINNHVQSFPVHSFWRFYLRDLGIIEAAACRYRSKDQLKNRKYQEKVEESNNNSKYYETSAYSIANKQSSAAALKLLFSTTDQHFFFYNPNFISDENLTLRYASPECLVGAPPTNSSDIWSCGMILSELISSIFTSSEMPDTRFDPIVERCGRGSLMMDHGNFPKGKLLDKSELWERITSGAGFPVSWVEARNRYSQTAHVPFSAVFGKKGTMMNSSPSSSSSLVSSNQNTKNVKNNNNTFVNLNPKLVTIGERYAGALNSTTNQVIKSKYDNSSSSEAQEGEEAEEDIQRISKYASYSTQNIEFSSSFNNNNNNNKNASTTRRNIIPENSNDRQNSHNSKDGNLRNTNSLLPQQQLQQAKNSFGLVAEGLNNDIVVARILSSTPGNPWKNQSPSRAATIVSERNIDPFVLQLRSDKQQSNSQEQEYSPSHQNNKEISATGRSNDDEAAFLSLARAYATAETVVVHSSPQRSVVTANESVNRYIAPLVGDFALYLAKRNVPQDIGQLLLSMMHFYPERRPSAVRCRRTPSLLQTASSMNAKMPITFEPFDDKNKNCNIVSSSASVRLHFAQTVDQSELHRKILAVLNSVKKRDSSTLQVEKLTELSHYLETLIVRGSLRNNFGRILEEILMSKSGMKKMENELEKATMKTKNSTKNIADTDEQYDEEVVEENKLRRLLGQQQQYLQRQQDRTGTSLFTADPVFVSMSTLQSMMKILVCLTNSRENSPSIQF